MGGWTFRPAEILAALPGLNAASARTHIMSRCCVNAPAHHAHRWPCFRRVRRGVYQILPPFRNRRSPVLEPTARQDLTSGGGSIPPGIEPARAAAAVLPPGSESGPGYWEPRKTLLSVEVRERGGRYVAESSALPPGVEGPTLESVVSQVVRLAQAKFGKQAAPPDSLVAELRLQIRPRPEPLSPLIAAYAKDIDRGSIRENLRLSVEERLESLQQWMEAMDEIRFHADHRSWQPGSTRRDPRRWNARGTSPPYLRGGGIRAAVPLPGS